jgi:TfoX/Sxy family transcriptional regulator of competence genes
MARTKQTMPKWTKAPDALVQLFDTLIADFPAVQKRTMFGYPVGFVSGQMCFGLFQDRVMMRLSETDREQITREHGAARFEPLPGRPMREYVEVPERILKSSQSMREWIARSVKYASSLPAKGGKPGAKKEPGKKKR